MLEGKRPISLTGRTVSFIFLPCSISDQKDPRERMVQVVKWYLSAFHAGRKGSVAKKPYNPILGEIFQCHWTLPNDTEENAVSSALMFLINNEYSCEPVHDFVCGPDDKKAMIERYLHP